jgi:hypothetical protein
LQSALGRSACVNGLFQAGQYESKAGASMQILVVHDRCGEIRSVAIPGHKLTSGEEPWRPAAGELVAVVDIPAFPEGTDLKMALERIRGEFRVSEDPARLISKQQAASVFSSDAAHLR